MCFWDRNKSLCSNKTSGDRDIVCDGFSLFMVVK